MRIPAPARFGSAIIASLAFAGMLWAAGPLPGQPDPARVLAGTYQADPAHTVVGWRVSHMGFNDALGLFGTISGTLVIDPAHLERAKVAVRIPVRKLTTASVGLTGALLRPNGNGSPDYFGPQPADAVFTSTAVVPGADGKSARIVGNLSLNGVTKPVTLNASFVGAGKGLLGGALTIGFHATTSIKRSDFGLTADLGLVGDQVDLEISAGFVKAK
ncbi:YceI family protein [Novosphingobium sp.]|uniref:YceI family protein n=1 Tax=Novosphingobium sp. TaxID=1874826 RepID=UPI00286C3D60|nr:YceI family protein [Novosphingobium sp.]